MLDLTSNRTIAILRPHGLAPSDLLKDTLLDHGMIEEEGDAEDRVEASLERNAREALDESIDRIRELIEETADQLKLHVTLYEYDLPSTHVPARAARKWIQHTNLITMMEPTNAQLAYVSACLRENPVMSALLAYRRPDFMFEEHRIEALDARSVLLLKTSSAHEKQTRVFASCMKWETEMLQPIISKALSYPFPVTPPDARPISA